MNTKVKMNKVHHIIKEHPTEKEVEEYMQHLGKRLEKLLTES